MHKLQTYRKLLSLSLVGTLFVVGAAVWAPAVLAADCPAGSVSYSGGCCPTSQEQISTNGTITCGSGCNGNPADCLFKDYINPGITLLSMLVGIAAVTAIIYGGIEFSSSGGDPQKAASGKKHITNAIIGLVAFIFLYAFLQFLLPGGIFHGQ